MAHPSPDAPGTLSLSLDGLPPARRARVLDAYAREAVADRALKLYPGIYERVKLRDLAYADTAEAVNRALGLPMEDEGFTATPRYVQAVMREGR